jgi:ABC-2 type transport system ATP-binding protein
LILSSFNITILLTLGFCLFKNKLFSKLLSSFGLISLVCFIIFLLTPNKETNLIYPVGNYFLKADSYQYQLKLILLFIQVCCLELIIGLNLVFERSKFKLTDIKNLVLIILGSLVLTLPHGIVSAFLNKAGGNLSILSIYQLVYLLVAVIYISLCYLFLSKLSLKAKQQAISLMSLAVSIQYLKYFTYTPLQFWNSPLHICNLGSLLLSVSALTKNRTLFLFTYYVNVIGALAALLAPLINDDFFHFATINYLFSHTNLVLIPILSVLLGIQKRPKKKEIIPVIFAFISYYVFSVVLGSFLFIYDGNVNFFYVIKDSITQFVPALKFLRNYQLVINKAVLYPAYQLTIMVIYIVLFYVFDSLYSLLYHFEDFHSEIRTITQLQKQSKKLTPNLTSYDLHNLVKINNLNLSYSNGYKALTNINFNIKRGEIIWLVGHNGAGKTSLIKAIAGILNHQQGNIIVNGYEQNMQLKMYKKSIGYASDNQREFDSFTAREYLDYLCVLNQVTYVQRLFIPKALKMLALSDYYDRPILSYSHGMKQKLAIISAILHQPDLLILDEPLSGLDIQSINEVKLFLKEYTKSGRSIIYSSHLFDVKYPLFDNLIMMKNGMVSGIYEASEIAKVESFEQFIAKLEVQE